jgi:hypothetical protein
VRAEVFTVVGSEVEFFWVVMLCGRIPKFHRPVPPPLTSEMLVSNNKTTQHYNPKELKLNKLTSCE